MPEDLENDQINRLWEHRLHIDNLFYERLSFFLVFESVLLGVVGVLYSRPNPVILVPKVISILGFIITIIWVYVQARHKHIFNVVSTRAKEIMPEYRITLERIDQKRWPLSATWLLAYVVPILVVVVWIILLLFL